MAKQAELLEGHGDYTFWVTFVVASMDAAPAFYAMMTLFRLFSIPVC